MIGLIVQSQGDMRSVCAFKREASKNHQRRDKLFTIRNFNWLTAGAEIGKKCNSNKCTLYILLKGYNQHLRTFFLRSPLLPSRLLFPKEFQIAAKIPNVTFFSNFSSWCRLHQPTVRKKDSIRKIRVNFRSLMEKWIYCRVYKHFRCFHFILIFDVNDIKAGQII